MAKKTTLDDVVKILGTHGQEIRDLTASVAHVVKHMATKDDIADLKIELKSDVARVQEQVDSIEAELKYGRYETRLGKLEEKVFRRSAPLTSHVSELVVVNLNRIW